MEIPPPPPDEDARLEALRSLDVLDTPPEERFDRLTRMASQAFDVPICLVSLVDADRQWFKSRIGLDAQETPRNISFCGHAILDDGPLIVEDSRLDERFHDNPLVCDQPNVRFYAGQPLLGPDGHRLGTLCLIDHHPRTFDEREARLLAEFARMVEQELTTIGLEAAAELVREIDQLHRSVVEALSEGVLVIDADGTVAQVNKSAARILRIPYESMAGRNMTDLSTIPEFQFVDRSGRPLATRDRPIVRTLLDGEDISNEIVGLRRASGDLTLLSVNSRVIGAAGKSRAVLSFVDVTERLQIDQMKDDFVAVVSHELRTPLTSIRGALGLLSGGAAGELPEQAATLVGVAEKNSERLLRLINDILDIQRMGSASFEMVFETVDLAGLVQKATDELRPLADQAQVEVLHGDLPGRLVADPDRIMQTLVNLISNAVKFSEPGSIVRVWIEASLDEVTVHVRDQGRGIPAGHLGKIFRRFEQVDASDSRAKGGTGLGLAICKEIVERHGGRIWVVSELDRGSTFSFSLPVSDAVRDEHLRSMDAVGDV